MEHLILYFVLSLGFLGFDEDKNNSSIEEYTSTRNLPVIIKNERIGKNRCRLHLDNGGKVEIACIHELYDS